jgi:hypothetical protein
VVKKVNKFIKIVTSNQSGIAIIMVMTTVALLTFVLAQLVFETKLNKIKVYNYQDKAQARLNAEAGLRFAMAKLRLYMEGRNLLEKNKDLKGTVQPSAIEQAVTTPFMYPIPIMGSTNIIQKTAIEEFTKNTLLIGKLTVEMRPVSGFLNPNNLRVSPKTEEEEEEEEEEEKESSGSPALYIEKTLIDTLSVAMQKKREEDDLFDEVYGNLNPELLIKELKYFVNSPDFFEDVERSEIEAIYLANDVTPKHAPMSSLDELYLLEGWSDAIIDLIKDRLTVHESSVIQVNEITENQLKIIFPDMTKEQTEEFFNYRDGNEDLKEEGKEFKDSDDFKSVMVNDLAIMDSYNYDSRIKEFDKAGLKIGVAGKLFKIISIGEVNRSVYTLTAFIDLPIKPYIPSVEDDKEKKREEENKTEEEKRKEEEEKAKQELMLPRVIEIRID